MYFRGLDFVDDRSTIQGRVENADNTLSDAR